MVEERRHRNYDAEFKKEAVRLVTERGIAMRKVAEDLGIHPDMFTRWMMKKYKATTDSRHSYHSVENLLQVDIPKSVWVSDITKSK